MRAAANKMTLHITMTLMVILLISACRSVQIKKKLSQSADSLHHHTGFVLYDPIKKKNLVSINGDKYFTPASNTKIFTLYAGLKMLGDSVPALRWTSRNDSLIFWGTGDPSFLYTEVFQNNRILKFLQNRPEKLFFSHSNFKENVYGPGWSWDDYAEYYQPERSAFPMYGNIITVNHFKGIEGIQPPTFRSWAKYDTANVGRLERDKYSNNLTFNSTKFSDKVDVVPFVTSDTLTARLLSDTLKRKVRIIQLRLPKQNNILYSMPVDSLYKLMMQESDNFIAEQILLMCAQSISDTLKTDIAISKVRNKFFADSPDPVVWVDGSGLSRYNQFTPRTIVKLWTKIYETIPRERLFPLLATNAKPGTLRSMMPRHSTFVFGKTGSLSNNYCLSGYLVTKKNTLLIFSSMNTGFISPSSTIRKNLSKTLQYIYEHY